MDLIIQTFPLDGKTLYYVQCPVCKNNRILNSGANVSRIISDRYIPVNFVVALVM